MELLVICALGIVVACWYLTMRDIRNDLEREGVLHSLAAWWKLGTRKISRSQRLYVGSLRDDCCQFFPRRSPVPVRIRHSTMEDRLYRAHLYRD
jgi:hypothetical protein